MVRYGISGCGYFGRQMAYLINELEEAAVISVYSPGTSSESLAKELGCKRAVSFEELIATDEVDAVLIISPNNQHKEQVIQAAKARKHIFCEKPFALSIEDAKQMINTCKAYGVTLMVGHIMHYYEGIIKAKKLIEEGQIGKPIAVHVERTGWEERKEEISWKKKQDISGGHLFHHIHEIDLLQWMMGRVKSVYAVGDNLGHRSEGYGDEDDVILLTLEFEAGAFGTMQYGSGFRLGEHFIKINGTLGGLIISFSQNKLILKVEDQMEEWTLFGESNLGDSLQNTYKSGNGGVGYGDPSTKPPLYITKSMYLEIKDFHKVIQGAPIPIGKEDLFDGSSARESVAIAYTALKSKKSGKKESVE